MNHKTLKSKIIITVIAGTLLVCCYLMIFLFSSDNAEESSGISRRIVDMLVHWYYRIFGSGNGNVEYVPNAAYEFEFLEKIIRKLAHFAEYMAVGFLSIEIASLWIDRMSTGIRVVIVQLLISAGLDELHQYFVPGRYASLIDVMIDTAGGITGIVLVLWIKKIRGKRKRNVK